MASKPMLSLLNASLEACLIEGTRVRESGLIVSTEVVQGETILFFHIDCEEGRKNLNLVGVGSKICDYLVFYTKDEEDKEIVCFLELKGKDLDGAIKQVLHTYQKVLELSKARVGKYHQLIAWKVCICLHGQAPRNRQSNIDQLITVFGKSNIRIKHGIKQYTLLGSFLREQTT
ncbi:MAG TPA: hypothetical protein VNG51_01635 [Ktedonobacteraceae bacterium]|nr:hypothetical protein [Ktedonobacteraceae bacterium]